MRRRFLNSSSAKTINIADFLTFEAIEDDFTLSFSSDCQYAIDGSGPWIDLVAGSPTKAISSMHTVSIKADLTPAEAVGIGTFSIAKKCNLSGNIQSLINFNNDLTHAFRLLFEGCAGIVDASRLQLPDFTGSFCYMGTFQNCVNLTIAPELPATQLEMACYSSMFKGCTSLINAPNLPATNLSSNCYNGMFYNCSNLTKAPDTLPATDLLYGCYVDMFRGCSKLVKASDILATTLVNRCATSMFKDCSQLNYIKAMFLTTPTSASSGPLYEWVKGVASSGVFVKNKDATWEAVGVFAVPSGWTIEYAEA